MLHELKLSTESESHPRVLFFKPSAFSKQQFDNLVIDVGNSASVEVLKEVSALERRLRSRGFRVSVVVLMVPDSRTMREISELMWLLEDVQIVAVIPDNDNDILSSALKLRPRYLTTVSDEPRDLQRVLENML